MNVMFVNKILVKCATNQKIILHIKTNGLLWIIDLEYVINIKLRYILKKANFLGGLDYKIII
jgi:hypothetical protein